MRRHRLLLSYFGSAEALHRAVEIAAGASAEHCCGQYGDIFDPASVAAEAGRAFDDLCRNHLV
jgi:hypothetical protein